MLSSCAHSSRILIGKSSAPAECVWRGGEGERGKEGGRETVRESKKERESIEKDQISRIPGWKAWKLDPFCFRISV